MKFLRLLTAPLFAAALILTANGVYSAGVVATAQKGHSAHTKKPAQFHYICPMHEDITSQKRGICPKCKMKLVRKPLPPKPTT
jgi:hypothetical protein